MTKAPDLPHSATDGRIGGAGMLGIACVLAWHWATDPQITALQSVFLLAAAYALPVILLDILVLGVHRRDSTGLDWSRRAAPDPSRIVIKLIGIAATVAAVFAVHYLFRFYSIDQLQVPLAAFLWMLPSLCALTAIYVAVVDGRMSDPLDSYWLLGAICLGRRPLSDLASLRDHALSWAIKGFFLPVMVYYLWSNAVDIDAILGGLGQGVIGTAAALIRIAVMVELTIVCVGYSLTLRLFDAHIRSPNGFMAAWLVTLACYYPFNQVISGEVFPYHTGRDWSDVLQLYPALTLPWITVMLASFIVWVWATSIFGIRWSNLTHRGIITSGPYRYTKHPDYVAKSVYFWMTAAPFLTASDRHVALTGSASLLVVNLIYFGRARMEEKHLSADPTYVEYALAMNQRSIFRGLARLLPVLIYKAPAASADPLRSAPGTTLAAE